MRLTGRTPPRLPVVELTAAEDSTIEDTAVPAKSMLLAAMAAPGLNPVPVMFMMSPT